MLPDRVSNPGPLTYESGALPIALRGPAVAEGETKVSGRTGHRTFYMYRVPEFRTMLTFTNYWPLKRSADLAY